MAIMLSYHYTTILERQSEGGYHIYCPTLPGCHTEGDTLDEALVNIKEAIEIYLESLKAHGDEIPIEDLIIKPLEVAV